MHIYKCKIQNKQNKIAEKLVNRITHVFQNESA